MRSSYKLDKYKKLLLKSLNKNLDLKYQKNRENFLQTF